MLMLTNKSANIESESILRKSSQIVSNADSISEIVAIVETITEEIKGEGGVFDNL